MSLRPSFKTGKRERNRAVTYSCSVRTLHEAPKERVREAEMEPVLHSKLHAWPGAPSAHRKNLHSQRPGALAREGAGQSWKQPDPQQHLEKMTVKPRKVASFGFNLPGVRADKDWWLGSDKLRPGSHWLTIDTSQF